MEPAGAVLGGGVGGLSAAHERVERGFRVAVYERRTIFGGKARSVTVPGTGRHDLPGEHGFRFCPSFYRHLPDTMARILWLAPDGSRRCAVAVLARSLRRGRARRPAGRR